MLRRAGVLAGRHGGVPPPQARDTFIDPETGEPHILNHDVDELEVAEVLENAGEDRPGREGSRVAIGKAESGRYLRVIYVPDSEPDSVFVITAYELSGKPLVAYRSRRRKKMKR